MTPNTQRSPGDETRASVEQSASDGNSSNVQPVPALLKARTLAGPPCTRRRLWLAVVSACPSCCSVHQFRAGDPSALLAGCLVRRCPVTGTQLRLAPVRRGREARHG